jgi:type III pantothenate kinase
MPEGLVSLLLTLDLGNSRCKLRLWDAAGDAQPRNALELAPGELLTALVALCDAEGDLRHAALSSVGAPGLEAAAGELLRHRLGEGYLGTPHSGLEIATSEPERVGSDRLFAARGALELEPSSAIVVDAGTALTVDALEVRASPGERPRGRFLGGAIAPGPRLLARALADGTARLGAVEPRAGARALGRDTREALEAGVAIGFRGTALELVRRVGEESGLGTRRLVLTGGSRELLCDPPLFTEHALEVCPDLVHLGLRAAGLDLLAASAPTHGARGSA